MRNWSELWEIVQRVDRSNFGLCLDSFQTCGGEFGDPTTSSGTIATASAEVLQTRFEESLEAQVADVQPERIFILQISGAYQMDPPLENRPGENGLRSKGRRSHNLRLLPYDGEYLPVAEVTRAVL